MYYVGDFDMTDTVYVVFNTFSSDDPSASVTITDLADGDIHIHKDGSATQRSSGSGVTVTTNFDSITGNHLVAIDLTDNTDAGYYATGSTYLVRMEGTTIDAAVINAWIGQFTIGKTRAAIRTEIGIAGSSLAAIPWNSAWDAEVESEVVDGIASGTALSAIPWNSAWDAEVESEVVDGIAAGTALSAIPWNSAWDAEVESEVQDVVGAAGSSLTAVPWNSNWDAEVESEVVDGIAAGTALTSIPWNSDWDAEVESEVVDGIAAGTALTAIPWNSAWDAEVESEVVDGIAAGTALTSIPWNSDWDAEVQSEVTDVVGVAGSSLTLLATAAALTTVDTVVDAIKAKTDNLPEGIKKNTALSNFPVLMVLSSDHVTSATGKTVSGYRSIDGGAFASVTGAIAEVSNGLYQFDAAAADTNGDTIMWRFTATDCDDTWIPIKTEE